MTSIGITLLSPFLVLFGFILAYIYALWSSGFLLALGSGVLGVALYILGKKSDLSSDPKIKRPATKVFPILLHLSIIINILLLILPLKYNTENPLSVYGEGILNSSKDDYASFFGIYDGYETAPSSFERRYRLSGGLLSVLGRGYDFGNPPEKDE